MNLVLTLALLGWAPCAQVPPPGSCVALASTADTANVIVFEGELIRHWDNGFSLIHHVTPAGADALLGTVDPGLLCPLPEDK
jgi:hypothetical protein